MSPLDTLLQEAAGWLADCGMRVPETETALALKVNRTFDGGWEFFVAADPSLDRQAVFEDVRRRFPQNVWDALYPAPDPTPTGDPLPIRG